MQQNPCATEALHARTQGAAKLPLTGRAQSMQLADDANWMLSALQPHLISACPVLAQALAWHLLQSPAGPNSLRLLLRPCGVQAWTQSRPASCSCTSQTPPNLDQPTSRTISSPQIHSGTPHLNRPLVGLMEHGSPAARTSSPRRPARLHGTRLRMWNQRRRCHCRQGPTCILCTDRACLCCAGVACSGLPQTEDGAQGAIVAANRLQGDGTLFAFEAETGPGATLRAVQPTVAASDSAWTGSAAAPQTMIHMQSGPLLLA